MEKFLFIFCCMLATGSPAQPSQYSRQVELAMATYSYLEGQAFALRKLAHQFPTLDIEIKEVEKHVSKSFMARAQKNIEQLLLSELGQSGYATFKDEVLTILQEQYRKPVENESLARDFLNEVRARLNGQAPQPQTNNTLAFAYHDFPHEELIDGFVKTFEATTTACSNAKSLKIPVPQSWSQIAAENNATAGIFTSCSGTGGAQIILMIHNVPNAEPDTFFSDASVREMIPPGHKVVRIENTQVDFKPGVLTETEEEFESGGQRFKVRMIQFMYLSDEKLYCIQGSVGPAVEKYDLEPEMKRHETLFRLVAQSAHLD